MMCRVTSGPLEHCAVTVAAPGRCSRSQVFIKTVVDHSEGERTAAAGVANGAPVDARGSRSASLSHVGASPLVPPNATDLHEARASV